MSDAIKDLPDPLDAAPTAVDSASPDDLLSQLADDAIDQLMQEGDATSASSASPASPAPTADVHTHAPADTEDTGLDVLPDEDDHAPAAADQMPPPVDVPAEIADLATNAPAPADLNHDAPVAATADASNADVKALLDDALAADAEQGKSRVLLWPLRVINAPFSGVNDGLRDVLGQVAIITLINALAVLLYVILFR